MTRFNRQDPSAEAVKNLGAPGTAQSFREYSVVVDIAASASNFGWQNPDVTPAIAYDVSVYWTTTGTGTIDVGTGTGGTGTNTRFIDGGTMDVMSFANGAGGTLGTSANYAAIIGGSGSAGDSVVLNHNEAATGTAVGYLMFKVRSLEAS